MFTPLSRDEISDIVKLQFKQLQNTLQEMGITIEASEEALDWLSQLGYDPQFGARPLKRVIQKKILNELSKQILAGKIDKTVRSNWTLLITSLCFKRSTGCGIISINTYYSPDNTQCRGFLL